MLLDPGGRGLDAVFLIGEQVDVLRRARRQAVGQQRVPAAQREPVPGRGRQRDGCDLLVQVADRHQVLPGERSVGCSSSQASRTPAGSRSSGHKLIRTPRLR